MTHFLCFCRFTIAVFGIYVGQNVKKRSKNAVTTISVPAKPRITKNIRPAPRGAGRMFFCEDFSTSMLISRRRLIPAAGISPEQRSQIIGYLKALVHGVAGLTGLDGVADDVHLGNKLFELLAERIVCP